MRIDDLVTAAAKGPYRYSDEWFSATNPEHVFTLSGLRKVLHDFTARHGGEWAYDRAYDRETIYYRDPASSDWIKAWLRVPDR